MSSQGVDEELISKSVVVMRLLVKKFSTYINPLGQRT